MRCRFLLAPFLLLFVMLAAVPGATPPSSDSLVDFASLGLNCVRPAVANVLLIHGILRDRHYWDPWETYLRQHADGIIFRTSPGPSTDLRYDIVQQVWTITYDWKRCPASEVARQLDRDIRKRRSDFAGRPLSIIGHSKGGLVARAFAVEQVPALERDGIVARGKVTLIYLDTPHAGCSLLGKEFLDGLLAKGATVAVARELEHGYDAVPNVGIGDSYAIAPDAGSEAVALASAFDQRLTLGERVSVTRIDNGPPGGHAILISRDLLKDYRDTDVGPFGGWHNSVRAPVVCDLVFGYPTADGRVEPGLIQMADQFFVSRPPAVAAVPASIMETRPAPPPWLPPDNPPAAYRDYSVTHLHWVRVPARSAAAVRFTRSAEWTQGYRLAGRLQSWTGELTADHTSRSVTLENRTDTDQDYTIEAFHLRPGRGWYRTTNCQLDYTVEGRGWRIRYEDGSYSGRDDDFDDLVVELLDNQ